MWLPSARRYGRYSDIDKKNATLEATEFAKPIIGISKWSDVVPNFKWKNLEK